MGHLVIDKYKGIPLYKIMQQIEQEENGAWYKDESGAEVFIPNDDEKIRETWRQASSLWQQAQSLGVVGRAK